MYKLDDGLPFYQRVYGQDLALKQSLPQSKKEKGNKGPIEVDGINGSLEILARANADVTIADGKKLTITLEHSDTGKDADWNVLGTLYTLTASSGSGLLKKGVELDRFPLKSTVKRYLRAQIETDDGSASGTLDIIPVYLPR